MMFCVTCGEYDCVITLPSAKGPTHRCIHCGPVLLCPLPVVPDAPQMFARSLDDLSERLLALLDPDDIPEPDVPPLVIEPCERRISPRGCVICNGPVTFQYWVYDREVEPGAWCDACGAVELVTSDPLYPKFRPVRRQRMRLVHSR